MTLFDKIRIIKAKHFIRFMDFYIWLYGRFRFGTPMQKIVTAMSTSVCGAVPYVLKIDLLENCNLKCSMCYAHHSKKEMSLEDYKKIVSPLKGIGSRVDLMGGEPFLYSNLEEVISYTRNVSKFKEVIVYTNGTFISKDKALAVKEAGLTHAMVNLSSHDEIRHDAFTGVQGSWKSAIEGINNLKEAGVETNAFIVVHKDNIFDLNEIRTFVLETLQINPLFFQYVPKDLNDPLIPSRDDWNLAKKNIIYGHESGQKHGKIVAGIISLCGKNCLGGYHSFSVKVNGDVTPCPFIHDIIIGNALKDGIWKVFLNRKKSKLYNEFSSIPEECKSCNYITACSGGCRAGQDGEYLNKDFRCLGPWHEKADHDKLFEKIPTFF